MRFIIKMVNKTSMDRVKILRENLNLKPTVEKCRKHNWGSIDTCKDLNREQLKMRFEQK